MIKKILKSLLLILLLFVILMYTVLFTHTGLILIYYVIKNVIPIELTIGTLEGQLAGPLLAKEIQFQDGSKNSYMIKNVQIVWDIKQLFKQQILIELFQVDQLDITLSNTASTTNPSSHSFENEFKEKSDLFLPFNLQINQAMINRLHLNSPSFPAPLEISRLNASVNFTQNNLKVVSNWQSLIIPLDNQKEILLPWGNIKVNGLLSDYQITGQFLTLTDNFPSLEWYLDAKGNLQELSSFSLKSISPWGHTLATGHINWQPHLKWQTVIISKALKPNQTDVINFKLTLDGELEDKPSLYFKIDELTGNFQNFPVTGKGNIVWKNDILNIDKLNIKLGQALFFADGKIDNQWQLQWHVDIPNFNTILPIAAHQLKTEGLITGNKLMPIIEAKLSAGNLKYDNFTLNQLEGNIKFNLQNKENSFISLSADQILYDNNLIARLNINAKGTEATHTISATLTQAEDQVNFNLEGHYAKEQWQALIKNFGIKSSKLANWQLKNPVTLTLSKNQANLPPLCLQSLQGQLCTAINWNNNQFLNFMLEADKLESTLFSNYLPHNIHLNSQISFKGNLKANLDKIRKQTPSANLDVTLSPGTLQINQNGQLKTFTIENTALQAKLTSQGLKSIIKTTLNKISTLNAEVALPKFNMTSVTLDQPVKAQAKINLNDLSFISSLSSYIDNVKGLLTANISVSGQLNKPQIKTDIKATGSFTLPSLGLKIKQITFNAKNISSETLVYNGQITSGPGVLKIKGETKLKPPAFPTQLFLTGENVEITNTPEINVLASPQLKLVSNEGNINITGNVIIPKALISPQDFSSSVTVSDDVVFVKHDKPQSTSHSSLQSNIHVTLGDNVIFDFMGLKGNLVGSILLKDSSEQATIAYGQLSIKNGSFSKYNQTLNIQHGQLLFTGGAVDNPGINLKASKKITTYQKKSSKGGRTGLGVTQYNVGIQVLGNVNQPLIKLFSEPQGLSESEILSYLVLSAPLSQTEGGEGQLLMQALQGLNLTTGQTGMIQKQLQQKLGLDQLSVSSGEVYNSETQSMVQNTSLVLGKMLSPKLLLSYSIGLFEPINILKISYKLTDKFTLQSETSTESSGIDVFYSIERD